MILVYVAVVGLAAYRLTILAVKDVFPPVLWTRDRIVGGWRPLTEKELSPGQPWQERYLDDSDQTVRDVDFGGSKGTQVARYVRRAGWVPFWLADLVSCPWCASGWISLAATAVATAAGWFSWWPAFPFAWAAVWAIAAHQAAKDIKDLL